MGLVSLSSFVGTVDADKNLVEQFKAEQKKKHPTLNFDEIKKLAIQAPEATEFSINGENFVMPSTGIFELGYGLVDVYELIFNLKNCHQKKTINLHLWQCLHQ